jgi:hypothetical protein
MEFGDFSHCNRLWVNRLSARLRSMRIAARGAGVRATTRANLIFSFDSTEARTQFWRGVSNFHFSVAFARDGDVQTQSLTVRVTSEGCLAVLMRAAFLWFWSGRSRPGDFCLGRHNSIGMDVQNGSAFCGAPHPRTQQRSMNLAYEPLASSTSNGEPPANGFLPSAARHTKCGCERFA